MSPGAGLLLYGNYVMLAPHCSALFLALLASLLLHGVAARARGALARVDALCRPRARALALLALLACAAVALGAPPLARARPAAAALGALVGVAAVCMDRASLVAACLTVGLIVGILVPGGLLLRQCVREAQQVTTAVLGFIDSSFSGGGLQTAIDAVVASPLYAWAKATVPGAEEPGAACATFEDAARLKAALERATRHVGGNVERLFAPALYLFANLRHFAFNFATFLTTLYFFLQTPGWGRFLAELSPLSEDDNARLVRSVKDSSRRIFLCSGAIFGAHMLVSYASFRLAGGLGAVVILSLGCGYLATLPMLGDWIVWVPVALSLLCVQGRPAAALGVAGAQLFARFYVDYVLYDLIPGNTYYVGLSARQNFAEHVFGSNALHCTATARILIPAECAAVS